MAENKNQQPKFQCSGDCLKCLPAQRQYCASQHAYSNMKVLDVLVEMIKQTAKELEDIRKDVAAISVKIESILSNEESVFNPSEETQSGSGV